MVAAPKTVSIAYSQLSDKVPEKKIIYEVHHQALEKAIDFLAEQTTTRRFDRAQGFREEKADVVVAAFTHQTSRLNDPLLHTHALMINLCFRADGSTGSINSHQLYVNQKEAGALYRAEMALLLEERLGLELRRKSSWFEIAGIPETAINYFSKRRNEIEAKLDLLGYHSRQANEYVNLNTRRPKEYRSQSELQADWKEQGQALGLSEQYILSLFRKDIKHDLTEEIQTVVNDVSRRLSQLGKSFSNRDVMLMIAEESQGRGIGFETARSIGKAYLASDDVRQVKQFQKSSFYEYANIIQVSEEQKQPEAKIIAVSPHRLLEEKKEEQNREENELRITYPRLEIIRSL